MAAPRLIKKYSSRRLYDVAEGRFVTLAELFELIRSGNRIKAVDSQGRDITRSILLQVLAEQEVGRDPPLLSVEVLHEMVGMYGNVMQSVFARFIDEGMAGLIRQQSRLRHKLESVVERSTSAAFSGLMDPQTGLWNAGQRLVSGLIRGDKSASTQTQAEAPEVEAEKPKAARRKPRTP